MVAQTTATIAIGDNDGLGFVASVVTADACTTTLRYKGTAGTFTLAGVSGEGDDSIEVRQYSAKIVVQGKHTDRCIVGRLHVRLRLLRDLDFQRDSSHHSRVRSVVFGQSCSLAGTTSAVCSVSVSVASPGTHTTSTAIVTLPGSDVPFYRVPITAGASKLNGLGQCTATANAPSAGSAASSTNAAVATGVQRYKVLVVPGAAALLTAAAF